MLPGGVQNDRAAGEYTGVCCFSPSLETFAVSGGDGRVRLFDAATGRVSQALGSAAAALPVTPSAPDDGDVADTVTALAWLPPLPAAVKSGKSKRRGTGGAPPLCAGTRAGGLLAWDTTSGDVRWRARRLHGGAVTSVCLSSGRLFSASSDGVAQSDPASGELTHRWAPSGGAVSCVAASPDGLRLLLCHAGGGVGVWDAASRRRERPLSGHAAPGGSGVLCACFSDDGTMGATAARGDRSVALWDLAAPHHAASAPAAPAVRRLALPRGEPLQLRLWCGGGGGGGEEAARAHILVAVSSCGDAFVWRLDASGADAGGGAGAAAQQPMRVALLATHAATTNQAQAQPGAARDGILSADVVADGEAGVLTLIVAYGSVARVSLCRAPLPADAATVLLPPSAAAAAAAAAAADGAPPRHRPAPTFGGADNAVDASIPRPAPTRKRPAPPTPEGDEAGGHDDGGGANGGAGGAGGAGAGNGSGDASLGDRLRALELATSGGAPGDGDGRGAAPPLGLGGGGAGGDDAAATAFGAGGALPRADSLALLLSQSLRAGDVALLERVLTVGDARVQRATCRSLPPALAVTLLSCLVSRLGSSPRRAPQLADWLGALLPCHAAHFAAAPGAGPPLAQLFGLIEARAPMHRPLCALHGRLRLLLDASRRGGGGGEGDDDADAPIEYVEGEEEGAAGEEDATKGVADGDDTGGDDDSSSDDEGEEEAGADDADDSEGDTSSSDGEEEP